MLRHVALIFLFMHASAQNLDSDIVANVSVPGESSPGGFSWADSYSVGNYCYCNSTYDHDIGIYVADTPLGWRTVLNICSLLGPGPGNEGRPIYNDIQCGNGPPNDAGDEQTCPGRVDLGRAGCGLIGPKWNFDSLIGIVSITNTTPPANAHPDVVAVIPVVGEASPGGLSWADSYSVGDRCYCNSTFDHGIGPYPVQTPNGWLTVQQACALIGPGPGYINNYPLYNDVQCGNGPPNDAGDEITCPGRVDIGAQGCGQIGPKWNWLPEINVSIASIEPTSFFSIPPSVLPSTRHNSSLSPVKSAIDTSSSPAVTTVRLNNTLLPSETPSAGEISLRPTLRLDSTQSSVAETMSSQLPSAVPSASQSALTPSLAPPRPQSRPSTANTSAANVQSASRTVTTSTTTISGVLVVLGVVGLKAVL